MQHWRHEGTRCLARARSCAAATLPQLTLTGWQPAPPLPPGRWPAWTPRYAAFQSLLLPAAGEACGELDAQGSPPCRVLHGGGGGDAPSRPKGLRSSKPLAPPTNCPCPALHYGWPMQHGPSPWQSLLPRRACVEPSARLPLLPLPAPRRRFSASMPLKAASPGRCSGSPVPGAAGNPPARTPALSATAPPPPLPTPAGMVRGLRFGMPIMLPGPHDARILHSTTSFVKEFCGAPISRHHVGEQAAPRSPHNMHTSHLQAPSLPKKP